MFYELELERAQYYRARALRLDTVLGYPELVSKPVVLLEAVLNMLCSWESWNGLIFIRHRVSTGFGFRARVYQISSQAHQA